RSGSSIAKSKASPASWLLQTNAASEPVERTCSRTALTALLQRQKLHRPPQPSSQTPPASPVNPLLLAGTRALLEASGLQTSRPPYEHRKDHPTPARHPRPERLAAISQPQKPRHGRQRRNGRAGGDFPVAHRGPVPPTARRQTGARRTGSR